MKYSIPLDWNWLPYVNALQSLYNGENFNITTFEQQWKSKFGVSFVKITGPKAWLMEFESKEHYVLFMLEWS